MNPSRFAQRIHEGTCVQFNGERYPLVGGTRQRRFAGTSLKPRKLPKNAQTPTSRVHAVLGCGVANKIISGKSAIKVSPSILSLPRLFRSEMPLVSQDPRGSQPQIFLHEFLP
jgi:hypothetical protein